MKRSLKRWFGASKATPAPATAHGVGAGAARLMRLATIASVAVATMLVAVKASAWVLTDSISILSSLVDSVMDAMISVVNLIAVHHALRPPDREHRFGHGKAEPLAGLAQAAFVMVSAVFLSVEAGHRVLAPRPVARPDVGIAVMVFAIVATVGLVAFQRLAARRSGSTAVGADALHYESDALVNASVIVSVGLSKWLGWHLADPLFGIAIALYLVRGSWRIAAPAFDLLMDREFPEQDRARIRDIVLGHDAVRGVHELRTRSSGVQPFIQLHLELDGDMPLREAHAIADAIEARIRRSFPGAEIIIHQCPYEPSADERPQAVR